MSEKPYDEYRIVRNNVTGDHAVQWRQYRRALLGVGPWRPTNWYSLVRSIDGDRLLANGERFTLMEAEAQIRGWQRKDRVARARWEPVDGSVQTVETSPAVTVEPPAGPPKRAYSPWRLW